jgi:hypothetical protein
MGIGCNMGNREMKSSQNLSIPKGVSLLAFLPRKYHDETILPKSHGVLVTTNVICSVVDPKPFWTSDIIEVINEADIVLLRFRQFPFVTIIVKAN